MADVSDYPEAVERIYRSAVEAPAPTEAALRDGLERSAQLTPEVVDNFVDSVPTAGDVLDGLEQRGGLPSSADIEQTTNAIDEYGLREQSQEVADTVENAVVTRENVRAVTDVTARATDGPTFREDIEGAVSQASEGKQFVGSSRGEVVESEARRVGAPSESSFRREAAQTVAQADSVTPSEVVEGTQSETPVQVIRDESGEAVAATGGPGGDVARETADELGAEYRSTEEIVESMDVEGTGGDTAALTLEGRKIGEVDL